MIGIINYGCGNVGSVKNMLSKINVWSQIISDPLDVKDKDVLILPGVGSFDYAVNKLKESGFWDSVIQHVQIEKKPILGICLGMQLFFEGSDEGVEKGFGWLKGDVKRFKENHEFRIPNIGWQNVKFEFNKGILSNEAEGRFYFVHSYHAPCELNDDYVLAYSYYQYKFPSAIICGNIVGFQFHPEKSLSSGMNLFKIWYKNLQL